MQAWTVYRMCRHLHCSYQDVMDLPETTFNYFQAFMAGEARAARERDQNAAGGGA